MNILLPKTPVLETEVSFPSRDADLHRQSRNQTASQFEALLIGQIMRTMRESSGSGWLSSGDDQSGSALGEFAEQHLSQVIAQQGGFGLAALIEQGLAAPTKESPLGSPRLTP